jgi:predicted 2-oxoglutarate/Fe(II)-dependent dioxygenase YbiX
MLDDVSVSDVLAHGVRDLDARGRHAEATDLLRRGVQTGDLQAMCLLGKRLVTGRDAPFSPQEGVALLRAAADQGDAAATATMAGLTAAGAWMEQSWSGALNLLQLAAERGSFDARIQLGLLAPDARDAGTDECGYWKRLRGNVVLESWIVPRTSRQVSTSPRVWVVEKFASAEICDWIVARARGRLTRARVFSGRVPSIDDKRSNSSFGVDIIESGVLFLLLRLRIMGATTLPVSQMEPANVLHYANGEEFGPHFDFLENSAGEGGERLATFLLYLNDDFDGGELDFLDTGFCHKGAKGDAVFFANVTAGQADLRSRHAGRRVTRGEKWLLSQWIRDRPVGAKFAA